MFQTPKVTSSGTRRKKTRDSGDGAAGDQEVANPSPQPPIADVHPALAGVLSELPRQGAGWTRERRDGFMKTFQAVVEFTIPVVSAEDGSDDEYEDVED